MNKCKYCGAEVDFYYDGFDGRQCRYKCGSIEYENGEYDESVKCLKTQVFRLQFALDRSTKGAKDE